MTLRQGRKWKADLLRELDRDAKAKARAELRALRAELKRARVAKRGAMGLARARCVAERKALRGILKERRERLLAELRATTLREKLAAREACELEISKARKLKDVAEQKHAEVEAERAHRKHMRIIEHNARERLATAKRRRTPAEAMAESNAEVEGNISADLVPLWRRVKGSIRGTDRKSRTEAFLHYAEENPGEILEALQDRSDVLVRELEARYAKMSA